MQNKLSCRLCVMQNKVYYRLCKTNRVVGCVSYKKECGISYVLCDANCIVGCIMQILLYVRNYVNKLYIKYHI